MSWLQRLRCRFFRPRYHAVIVGNESGNVHEVSFVQFYYREAGERWCQMMNAKDHHGGLSRWELVKL